MQTCVCSITSGSGGYRLRALYNNQGALNNIFARFGYPTLSTLPHAPTPQYFSFLVLPFPRLDLIIFECRIVERRRLFLYGTLHQIYFDPCSIVLICFHILYPKRATLSAAGPFGLLGLSFRRLGASILTFWEPILAPRQHLGEPFWHLGTTLEDRGNIRMDSRW